MKLILASGSPRRRQMLADLGVAFKVQSPDIDESRLRGEPSHLYVQRLAFEKAESVRTQLASQLGQSDWAILAADTIVVSQASVLGKPKNEDEAYRMLKRLSGRTHEVITGFSWQGLTKGHLKIVTQKVRTKVTFSENPADFWRWYAKTGEPMDKAGAYAAQGIGLAFIEKVSGSYSNVIGLPLPQVLQVFKKTFGGDLREYCEKSK